MRFLVQVGLVAFGSAIGGLLRWGVTVFAARLLGTGFPWGTFFINLSGSLFLGWFSAVLANRLVLSETSWLRPDDLRLMIAVGFTGAYTTFSTFEYETYQLVDLGSWWLALANVAGSVLAGFVGVLLGVALASLLFPRH